MAGPHISVVGSMLVLIWDVLGVKTLSEFFVGSGESHYRSSSYSSSVRYSREFSTKLAQFGGVLFLYMNGTVVKWSSNTTWYWGET